MSGRPAASHGDVPLPVLRQWSDALAAAGLFAEALLVHPAVERADLVRRSELAILVGDHQLAEELLAELAAGRTARSVRPKVPGLRQNSGQVSPWLKLLTRSAQVLAEGPERLAGFVAVSQRVPSSAGVCWVIALTAAAAGDLTLAASAAEQARAGGCRDLRILAVLAADRAAQGDDVAALDLAAGALRTALPGEDPTDFVVDLLERAGFKDTARRVAALGAADPNLPAGFRAAWRASARRVGAGHKLALRRSLTAAGSLAEKRRNRVSRRLHDDTLHDLTCRCYGSAGWIGDSREYYVQHHLSEVLAMPVAGLAARLLRCRATNLTFLDLAERRLTLPVVSEIAGIDGPDPAGVRDPDARPTPGMGVSLGSALPFRQAAG